MPSRIPDPVNENPNEGRADKIRGAAHNVRAVPSSGNGVIFPLLLALGVNIAAGWKQTAVAPKHGVYKLDGLLQSLFDQNWGAWIIVWGGLLLMADINATQELAVALAWLIAIALILSKGENALQTAGFFPNLKTTPLYNITKPKK